MTLQEQLERMLEALKMILSTITEDPVLEALNLELSEFNAEGALKRVEDPVLKVAKMINVLGFDGALLEGLKSRDAALKEYTRARKEQDEYPNLGYDPAYSDSWRSARERYEYWALGVHILKLINRGAAAPTTEEL